jgi:ABC-type bacteriocin/lantibiotic exporter with double-glycine peptidase domain
LHRPTVIKPEHCGPRVDRNEESVVNIATAANAPAAAPDLADGPALKVKIAIQNLDFHYGQSKALKNISLPLYANTAAAFIGPSGCGKSTLLRVPNRM